MDTSVWVDHLRAGSPLLARLLDSGSVLTHPCVVGELALGNIRRRETVLNALMGLPQARMASDAEVLHFVDRNTLFGRGIGYVDAHLLAATRLTTGAALWTRDKRLQAAASSLGLAFQTA